MHEKMPDVKEWKNVYIEKSKLYLREFEAREKEGKESAGHLARYLRENYPEKKKVLDFPCGNGRISRHLAGKGFEILGMDFSEVFIKDAQDKFKDQAKDSKIEFAVGELSEESTLKRIESFSPDVILNWWTSFGYSTKEADRIFFEKLREVVLPGTILLVETWHRFPVVDCPIRTRWDELGDLIVLVKNFVEPLKASVKTEHEYYLKAEGTLTYIDKFTSEIILYDIAELISMFQSCKWTLKSISNALSYPGGFDIHRDRVVLVMIAV